EAFIRCLLRGDTDPIGQQTACRHVFTGTIDRFHAEQVIAAIEEHRTRGAVAITANYNLVEAHGQASDLQFEIGLIASEPRYRVVGGRLAVLAGSDTACLIRSLLDRFDAHVIAFGKGVWLRSDFAGRADIG